MNCEEFEKLINDLACDKLMSVTRRAQAWTHKEECQRCAARLAQERLLTERLRLVASLDPEQAPARVKSALLSAFALQSGTNSRNLSSKAANPSAAPVFAKPNLAEKNPTSPLRSRLVWAAAAALILFAAITAVRLLNSHSSVETQAAPPILATGADKPQTRKPDDAVPLLPGTPQKDQVGAESSPAKEEQPVAGTRQEKDKRRPIARHAARSRSPETTDNLLAANTERNEVVTDYIPLTYMSNATALDSGLVVRVQVPRSTLISMGLPMNVESSKEMIKADVVVGDDGVARAIRFVHEVTDKADSKLFK